MRNLCLLLTTRPLGSLTTFTPHQFLALRQHHARHCLGGRRAKAYALLANHLSTPLASPSSPGSLARFLVPSQSSLVQHLGQSQYSECTLCTTLSRKRPTTRYVAHCPVLRMPCRHRHHRMQSRHPAQRSCSPSPATTSTKSVVC